MANIAITTFCAEKCPYCFADEFVVNESCQANKKEQHIDLHNFKRVIDFVIGDSKENNHHIGIIGGEPTSHPQFKELMEIAINDHRINGITLFTNGIYMEKYFKLLSNNKIHMLINCNSPANLGEEKYKRLVKNLETAMNEYYMRTKITLGINMYKENFDYEYIIDLLTRFNMRHVRTAITIPNLLEEKNRDSVEHFKRMKPSVFNFFRELEKYKIMPTWDCNIMPTCITTPEEKKWLEGFWQYEKLSSKYCNLLDCNACSPVIDIMPDMFAVRCFGMSREDKVPIYKFKNIRELSNYFTQSFDSFAYTINSAEKCEVCEDRQTMKCMGGCLAYKSNKIMKAKEFINDINNN